MRTQKQSIDAMLKNFDPAKAAVSERENSSPITIWIPIVSKSHFDKLQTVSNRQFGKILKQVVIQSIDSVKLED